MAFAEEKDFEKALIELLSTKGWEKDVLRFPTEEDLIQNWANILFENTKYFVLYFLQNDCYFVTSFLMPLKIKIFM